MLLLIRHCSCATHALMLICNCSRVTHMLLLTCYCSCVTTHMWLLMCHYSWVTAHVFLLICYYSCVHGQSYVIKCHTHTCLLIICMSRNNYLYNNVHNNLLYLNILYQGSWSFVKSHGNTFTFLFDLFQGGPFCLFFHFSFWRSTSCTPMKRVF